MPHVGGNSGVDLSSNDEIKVFQVEGEGEDEERSSSENLKEVKSSLVAEVPEDEEKSVQIASQPFSVHSHIKHSHLPRTELSPLTGKPFEYHLPPSPFGYVVSPYHPHANGALGTLSMVNRVPMVPSNHVSSNIPLMVYPEAFQPPPAHMGISPVHIDPKTGMARPPVYPLSSPSQYHPVFSPDFTPQFQWQVLPHSSMYSMASGFRPPPYPGTIPISSPSIPSKFSPTIIPPHPGLSPSISHPLLGTGPKIEMPEHQDSRHLPNFSHHNHHQSNNHHSVNSNTNPPPLHHHSNPQNSSSMGDNSSSRARSEEKKKNHIKKPLNAFMLFMKEMRSSVVAECTLKESAAINQILGRKWHNLTRDQQTKYYDMARKERQLHMQLYPGWSARDNYAINAKKKKRKRDKSQEGDGNNPKKCRARFGLDQQSSWCKPCRRKKKCVRYTSENNGDNIESEDNIGSVGSIGSEAPTPDSRFGVDASQLTDEDSGNGDIDDELEVSSEFSLSSPPVPRPSDNVQSVLENGRSLVGSPPSQQIHHPLNVQHLSRSSGHHLPDSPEGNLPQLPTPPSTDSSTTTAIGLAIT